MTVLQGRRRRAVDRSAVALWAYIGITLLALMISMVALAGWVTSPLQIPLELTRRLGTLGLSGLTLRRLINSLAFLVAGAHLLPILLLLVQGERDGGRPRAVALALLLLGTSGLAAGMVPPYSGWLFVTLPAALMSLSLVTGRAAARPVRRALRLSLLLFLLLAAAAVVSPLAVAPHRIGWANEFAGFPLLLLVWLPLPLVVTWGIGRGTLWQPRLTLPSMGRLRLLAIAALCGAIAGAVGFGVGSRLVMRVIALLGGIPPLFTLEGTMLLLVGGTFLGTGLGPLTGLWRTGARGASVRLPTLFLTGGIALLLILAPGGGELDLAPRPLVVVLFALLPLSYGAMFAPLWRAIEPRLPAADGGWRWLYGVGALAALLSAAMLMVPVWELAVSVARAIR